MTADEVFGKGLRYECDPLMVIFPCAIKVRPANSHGERFMLSAPINHWPEPHTPKIEIFGIIEKITYWAM